MRYAFMIICLVVGVAATVLLFFSLADPTCIPAPREVPRPLSSIG